MLLGRPKTLTFETTMSSKVSYIKHQTIDLLSQQQIIIKLILYSPGLLQPTGCPRGPERSSSTWCQESCWCSGRTTCPGTRRTRPYRRGRRSAWLTTTLADQTCEFQFLLSPFFVLFLQASYCYNFLVIKTELTKLLITLYKLINKKV